MEGQCQAKGSRNMNTPKEGQAGKVPIQATWLQMWANFLAVEIDRNKIGKQPSATFLELWRQLRPKQQFTKCGKHPQHEIQFS